MIDLNYKKHQLVLVDDVKNEYICTKCNDIFWYQDKDSLHINYLYSLDSYKKKHNGKYDHESLGWINLEDENCDELIIKNILE